MGYVNIYIYSIFIIFISFFICLFIILLYYSYLLFICLFVCFFWGESSFHRLVSRKIQVSCFPWNHSHGYTH